MLDSSVDRLTNSTFLVMEIACGGDLQKKLFAVVSKYFFIQMVSAIKYCHVRSPPIAHRGLNPANVLLTDSSDFAGVKVSSPHVLHNRFFFVCVALSFGKGINQLQCVWLILDGCLGVGARACCSLL